MYHPLYPKSVEFLNSDWTEGVDEYSITAALTMSKIDTAVLSHFNEKKKQSTYISFLNGRRLHCHHGRVFRMRA